MKSGRENRKTRPAGMQFALLVGAFILLFSAIVVWLALDQGNLIATVGELQSRTLPKTIEQQKLARNLEVLRLEGQRVLLGNTPEQRNQALLIVTLIAHQPSILNHARAKVLAGDTENFLTNAASSNQVNEHTQSEWLGLSRQLTLLADEISIDGVNLGTSDLKAIEDIVRLGGYKLGVAVLLTGLFVLTMLFLIRRSIIKPLQQIRDALFSLQKGAVQIHLPESNTDEIQIIRRAIDSLHVTMLEKESAQRGLRDSEERMRSFFDNVPMGIFISTREGKFTYINPAMPKMMGYDSCEEMMDVVNRSSIAEVLYVEPTQRQVHIENLDRQPSRWSFYQNRYRRKDGRIIDADLGIGERYDTISGEDRFYGIVTDTTERKLAEAELIAAKAAAETASLAKSRFLAAASHDLRQPIQAITLFADALRRTELSAQQVRISDYLSQSIQSLSDLLSVLQDISKLDAGVVKPHPEVIQVEALMHKIDAEFSPLAANRSLRFIFGFPLRDMAIISDGRLLITLLGNLIGNAIKYTPQGGVLVAIRRRGEQALIQVWDTGIGIAREHIDSIFEEYFQVGNPERDTAKGLGLGLSIAKRIGRLLETEVVCRSRPGKGSVFEFRLPLADTVLGKTPSRIEKALIDTGTSSMYTGRRIVLIEDDLMVATATQLALESFGMSITRYANAEEALAHSDIADADFYISDFRLPGLNGIEFLDAILQRTSKPVNAVLLTGDTSYERIGIIQSSAWPVLLKPIELSRLLLLIASQQPVHEASAAL